MDNTIPQDTTPDKRCCDCKQPFPATPQHFSRNKSKKDGLHDSCKICDSARRKAYTESHREQEYLSRKQFRENNKERLQEVGQQYRLTHKEQLAKNKSLWQKDNEQYKEYKKQWHQEHKQEIAEKQRKNYLEHREDRLEKQHAYRLTEKGKAVERAHSHKRKAQKRALEGTLTAQEIQTKLKAQKHRCYYCQKKFLKENKQYVYHLEHTIPVSRTEHNPRHDVNHIVLACPACNMEKHDKRPHEWARGNRLL